MISYRGCVFFPTTLLETERKGNESSTTSIIRKPGRFVATNILCFFLPFIKRIKCALYDFLTLYCSISAPSFSLLSNTQIFNFF